MSRASLDLLKEQAFLTLQQTVVLMAGWCNSSTIANPNSGTPSQKSRVFHHVPFRSSYFLSPPFLFLLLTKFFLFKIWFKLSTHQWRCMNVCTLVDGQKLHYNYVLAKHSCQVVWKFEVPCSITAFQGNMIIRALCNCESVLFVSAVDFPARALEPTNWRPLMETTREVNCICQRAKLKQKLLSWILLAHKRKAKKPLLFQGIFPCYLMNKENWCAVYWDDRLWQ